VRGCAASQEGSRGHLGAAQPGLVAPQSRYCIWPRGDTAQRWVAAVVCRGARVVVRHRAGVCGATDRL